MSGARLVTGQATKVIGEGVDDTKSHESGYW